ncbi:amidohydrolase/deacetylase family metallohydrolase [Candidatus Latescibacterota bacterium]
MPHDLLLKGGTLIDPAAGIHAAHDVAFTDGKVSAVTESLPADTARETIDATGCLVTPGMIDLHVHVFPGVSFLGVDPDPTCLARGATTVVDAGSAGADTFAGFRKYVIDVSHTRILAQLNISTQGMLSGHVGELQQLEYADVDSCCRTIDEHRDLILGVKVRLSGPSIVSQSLGLEPLHRARAAADAAGLPIMVHPSGAWCDSLDDVLAVMKAGDLLTHTYHGHDCGILDDQGRVRPAVVEAVERGVLLDVGHGAGSFSWQVVEAALEQGLLPHTISSDLHTGNLHGPVYDLATVVAKFLHLGLTLDEALSRVTSVPARFIGMEGDIGTLAPGAWGDAVVFEAREGQYQLYDAHREARTGRQRLEPVTVIKAGQVYRQRSSL